MNAFIPVPAQIEAVKWEIQELLDAQGDVPAGFNIDAWLEEWLQRPQPALGGRRPMELFASDAGIESVRRALGAAISGSYQ